jgi:hypothetical protein
MNLLIEQNEDIQCLITEGAEGADKNYFIEGIFIQSNIKNRNGRTYPKPIMERALNNFQTEIKEKRALGELGHPSTPTTNLDKVSHVIESLSFNGDDVIGKARLLDTPMGKIAKTFIKEGIKLGVSTRGTGTVKDSVVQNDFFLSAVDIVAQPSGPDCWVQGIMENTEWVYENGLLIEKTKDDINQIYKYKYTKEERDQKILALFDNFIKQL